MVSHWKARSYVWTFAEILIALERDAVAAILLDKEVFDVPCVRAVLHMKQNFVVFDHIPTVKQTKSWHTFQY